MRHFSEFVMILYRQRHQHFEVSFIVSKNLPQLSCTVHLEGCGSSASLESRIVHDNVFKNDISVIDSILLTESSRFVPLLLRRCWMVLM